MLDALIIIIFFFSSGLYSGANSTTLSGHWVGEVGEEEEHLALNEHLTLC